MEMLPWHKADPRLYKALIRVSDSDQVKRAEVHADSLEEARQNLEKYGEGSVYSLWNVVRAASLR